MHVRNQRRARFIVERPVAAIGDSAVSPRTTASVESSGNVTSQFALIGSLSIEPGGGGGGQDLSRLLARNEKSNWLKVHAFFILHFSRAGKEHLSMRAKCQSWIVV